MIFNISNEKEVWTLKPICLDFTNIFRFVQEEKITRAIEKNKSLFSEVLESYKQDKEQVLGWMDIDKIAYKELINIIEEKAKEIRENADVFILIGVGGSNQGARAVIKAFQKEGKPEILYAGNNLSPIYMNNILKQIEGKSVYANIIAKNFATLEPGVCFRVIRKYMEKVYGEEEAARRIIATGSPGGSSLEKLADEKGYLFLPFPLDVGGRYSVMSAVGLLPIAVSGVSLSELISGAKAMREYINNTAAEENDVLKYAVVRNELLKMGKNIEILSYFEPSLEYFSKWWVQLFGESEGKDGKGIFPTACSFSEDLHSLGQYIQSGQRIIFETFLNIENMAEHLIVPKDESADYFDYLDDKDFAWINQMAYEATVKAHADGGVPCMIVNIPELTPYYMGQLFYFFEMACYVSGKILGVNPFDQPGVEAYKQNMFKALGKV